MQATTEQRAEQRIRRHRSRLLLNAPFYGAVGAELELVMDPSCGTAWTDGKAIGFSPEFALSLPPAHLTGVIAHEILHVAMRHNYRRGKRDHRLWNEACDYAINGVLKRDGFSLPEDALLDERFEQMSAEAVYAKLAEEQQQQQQQQQQGEQGDGQQGQQQQGQQQPDEKQQDGGQGDEANDSGDPQQGQGDEAKAAKPQVGEVRDASSDAPSEQDWQTKIVNNAKQAQKLQQAYGTQPTEAAERAAGSAKQPRLNWRDVLQQFLVSKAREDFSWARPNRRHLSSDLHMPSMISEGAGTIAIAIDTSGSIDQPALDRFLAELQGVVEQIKPERVLLWCCDTKVRGGVQSFEPGDKIKPKIFGGGGTRFDPAFELLEEQHEEISCFIYFTDGMARMPKVEPMIPTLWAITTDQERHEATTRLYSFAEAPTFGETIYLGDEA